VKNRPRPNFAAVRDLQRIYSTEGGYYADAFGDGWVIKHTKHRGVRIPLTNATVSQAQEAMARLEA